MSSSSSSSLPMYDVFLSFRGIDTRKAFVSHLYHSLNKQSIRTFKDENELTGGGSVSPELVETIEESRFGVVVVSENYASSAWCLDVLAKITECAEKRSLIAVPILYEVDYSDVERQIEQLDEDTEKVKTWRDAYTKLFHTPPFRSYDWEDDSTLVSKITTYISAKLRATIFRKMSHVATSEPREEFPDIQFERASVIGRLMSAKHEHKSYSSHVEATHTSAKARHWRHGKGDRFKMKSGSSYDIDRHYKSTSRKMLDGSISTASSEQNGLVGMDRHIEALHPLLALGSNNRDVRVIGIWGIGGVGKTTLARCVYDQISDQFQNHCFLKNVGKIHQGCGSPRLLEEFVSETLKREAVRPRISEGNSGVIKARLGHRKLLLVADSVESIEQLKDLIEDATRFGPGSRVIITTQEKSLLDACGIKHTYQVECLRFDEALQLFCQFAFKRKHPAIHFEGLSIRAVQLSGQLPLALKLFGSYLSGQHEEGWKKALQRLKAKQYDHTTDPSYI